jgi:hypothetical protein
MGTIPAERSGEMAGIALQRRDYRRDSPKAFGPRPTPFGDRAKSHWPWEVRNGLLVNQDHGQN